MADSMVQTRNTIRVAAAQLPAITLNRASQALDAVCDALERTAEMGVDLLVLPECAYPAYCLPSVEAYRTADVIPDAEFLAILSERAKRHRLHVICGYVEDRGDRLHNAAAFIDDAGEVIGRTRKTFLWGDDQRLFAPGDDLPVFDCKLGRLGIAICADVRAPEVPAALAHRGAQLIAVPTCWVNVAKTPGQFYNPQPDFMIHARTRELGVPFVCANKFGTETDEIGYCGYSLITDANANVLASAPPDEASILTAELELRAPHRLALPEWTRERICSSQPAETPASASPDTIKIAAIPGALGVFANGADGTAEQLDPIQSLAAEGVAVVASSLPTSEAAANANTYARSLGMRLIAYPFSSRVMWDAFGSYGVIAGRNAVSFAPARALALDGAGVIFVTDAPDDDKILRTRAVENRVYVVATADRFAIVIGPDGAVLARCQGSDLCPLVVPVDLAAARDKQVFPRTDAFEQRRPQIYARIFS